MIIIWILLFMALSGLVWLPSKRWWQLKRWRRSLHLDQHEACFLKLFNDVNGFLLSKDARRSHDAMEYTYGEIEFNSFIALISLTHPTSETIFYDLGSGVGKAVIACAMVYPVKKSCGIELFPLLHQAALTQQKRLQRIPAYQTANISFICTNFLHSDFQDATHIFINSTALFGESWQQLCEHLATLASETWIITTSKSLPATHFNLLYKTLISVSWGRVHAYIHQRI